MKVVGIDPGLTGGIALLAGTDLQIWATPSEAKRSKGNRADCATLYDIALGLIKTFGPRPIDLVCIEQVSAMPKQGVSSQFSFGDSFGAVRMFGSILSARVEYVTPQRWKKTLGVGANKGHSITRAKQLYPAARDFITLKKHDGLAEALLIAHYARLYLSSVVK